MLLHIGVDQRCVIILERRVECHNRLVTNAKLAHITLDNIFASSSLGGGEDKVLECFRPSWFEWRNAY